MTNDDFLRLLSSASSVIKVHGLIDKLKGDNRNEYFKEALRQTFKRLDESFEKQLFGNSTESVLLNHFDKIVSYFEPYGHLEDLQAQLSPDIDFDTLPPNFFDAFKRTLIEEIYRFRSLRPFLASHLQSFHIDLTYEKVSAIPDIDKKLDKLISLVESSLDISIPVKTAYQFAQPYFIPRKLYLKSSNKLPEISSHSLLELIQGNKITSSERGKRLVILGYAGSGKSLELEYLQSKLSGEDSIYFPIKISLGNTNISDDCIEKFFNKKYPGWHLLDAELVILIDGLDEVSDDKKDSVRNQILSLKELKKDAVIIATCRNNSYLINGSDGLLSGFSNYYLPPFSPEEVNEYVKKTITEARQQQVFLRKIDLHGFREDKTTPFYLANLVDYFQEFNGSFPESKTGLFEYLIGSRKKREKAKSYGRQVLINKVEAELDDSIMKTAFVFQCTDKNFLSNQELRKVVGNNDVVEAVKNCYVLDHGGEEKWKFEHNNFKEYLCAKYLASKDFSFVEKILFVPKINKIKPQWLNTLGFLISTLPKGQEPANSLINHLKDNDPESLVRIEKDKLKLEIREHLFPLLFERYVEKGVYPQSPKFTTEDLGILTSDSENICNFLIEQISLGKSDIRIDLALYLLVRNSHWKTRKDEITTKIKLLLKSPFSSVAVKSTCISALGWFKIINRSLIDELMETLDLGNKEIKDRFFYYITNSQFLEDYFPFVLSSYLKKESRSDFKYGILFYLKKPESFSHILIEFNKQEHRYNQGGNIADTLIEMKEKSIFSDAISSLVYNSFKAHLQYFPNGVMKSSFIEYIDKFNLRASFFKQLLSDYFNDEQDSSLYCLHLLLDKNNVNYLIAELTMKNLALDKLYTVRDVLFNADDKEAFEQFYKKINKLYNNQLRRRKQKNIHQEVTKQEIILLHNKKYFLSVSSIFFGDLEKTIHKKHLYSSEWFKKHEDPVMLAAINILARVLGASMMTESQVTKFVNNRHEWDFLRAEELTQIMRRHNAPLDSKSTSFLKKWAMKRVTSERFKKTFFKNNEGEWRYYYPELLAASVCQYFNLDLSISDYAYLIRVDCHWIPYIETEEVKSQLLSSNALSDSRLLTYVSGKIGESQVELEIVRNLTETDLFEEVVHNHLRFLRLRERTEHKKLFLHKNLNINKATSLVWFVELEGELDSAVEKLKEIDDHERWSVVDSIIKKDKNILHSYLLESFERMEKKEDKAQAITYLLKCDQQAGLHKMRDWITTYRQFPHNSWSMLALNSLSNSKLEVLQAVCIDALENNYGREGIFGERRDFFNALAELGKSNKERYEKVSEFLTTIVNKYPNLTSLHGTIANMEFEFYKNQTYSMDLDEVLALMNGNKSVPLNLPPNEGFKQVVVDITKHHFEVALSFPGQAREYVHQVAKELETRKGHHFCFYDNNYKAQLARPSLDLTLQKIYTEASLVVVFLSGNYQAKKWCGLEFRAIREIIMERQNDRIMFVKMDDGKVEGVFNIDGYIDGKTHTSREVADFISERHFLIN